jgi:hypothetical protein
MNIKLADAESKVCELTAKLEELTTKESTIIVSILMIIIQDL